MSMTEDNREAASAFTDFFIEKMQSIGYDSIVISATNGEELGDGQGVTLIRTAASEHHVVKSILSLTKSLSLMGKVVLGRGLVESTKQKGGEAVEERVEM